MTESEPPTGEQPAVPAEPTPPTELAPAEPAPAEPAPAEPTVPAAAAAPIPPAEPTVPAAAAAPTPPAEPTAVAPAPPPPVAAPAATPAAPAVAWVQPEPDAGPAPGVEFAPHGGRLVAYIVDSLIIGALVIAVALVGLLLVFVTPILAGLLWVIGIFAVIVLYFPWFWVKGGQTPGMRLFDLHVVRDRDGGSVGWGSAILRLIGLYFIDGLVFYIGFIWIFIDKRRRAWHDLIAGTVVIKRPKT